MTTSTPHFGLLNEDLRKYLMFFHIALESQRRGELPPENMMEFLYLSRMEDLPVRAYSKEKRRIFGDY